MAKLVLIDDDRSVQILVERGLADQNHDIVTASNGDDGLKAIRDTQPDVALLDIFLPNTNGLDLFREIQEIDRKLPVIFITAEADSETAIQAIQMGAYDYIAKPLNVKQLAALVERAVRTREFMNVPVALGTDTLDDQTRDVFIGRSPQMLEVFKAIGRVAKQNVTVLIRGESGTGKELVARAIYQHSNRYDKPFLEVNCAALPDSLLESELFGHEKGSFTGADRRRIGKFEQCDGGTIFLDEVGDMSPSIQAKVLRLLQEQRFERVGGSETISTDVRVITATNRPLEQMVEDGEFRNDLLYRLNGVTIHLPPLRDRGDDIKELLKHFLSVSMHDLGKPDLEGLSPETLQMLVGYHWPGNVRELYSIIRQAILNTRGTVIVPEFLPPEIWGKNRVPVAGQSSTQDDEALGLPSSDLAGYINQRLKRGTDDLYAETLEMMERYLITRVLQETNGNQSKAAELLGITRGKIRDRIATFGITLDKNVSVE